MELNKLIQIQDCITGYALAPCNIESGLQDILDKVEQFYYGELWSERFERRIAEEGFQFNPIQLDILQGTSSELKEKVIFKLFDKDTLYNGVSNKDNMIALNINLDKWKQNDSHLENIVMHEFGHLQYNQKQFAIIMELNSRIFQTPSPIEMGNDLKYFENLNELRQRIIPIVKEMDDNKWKAVEAYEKSDNLKIDEIYNLYSKEDLIYWLDNIL